jgi:hypothetical protein
MTNETRDQIGYRIAVATIGVALIVALAGICVIVAVGEGSEIPKEMWSMVSALGGGLLGLLAPSPTPTTTAPETPTTPLPAGGNQELKSEDQQGTRPVKGDFRRSLTKAASANLSVVILLIVFVVAAVLGSAFDTTQFQALAAASGAALIGLLAPSPVGKHLQPPLPSSQLPAATSKRG